MHPKRGKLRCHIRKLLLAQKTKNLLIFMYSSFASFVNNSFVQSDTGGIRPNLIKPTNQNTAKVSLNDCLACSGCVTTAETILIQEHNADDFFNKIKIFKHSIVSISPQARASLSLYYNTNDLIMHYALVLFFKELGIKYKLFT